MSEQNVDLIGQIGIMTDYSNVDTMKMNPNRVVSKAHHYASKAKENNHQAIAFTENHNVFNWYEKKNIAEEHGLKYIHGVRINLVMSYTKDATIYNVNLYAKNYQGVLELNKVIGDSYHGREKKDTGGILPFYVVPRIDVKTLNKLTDNIVIVVCGLNNPIWQTTKANKGEEKEQWLNCFNKLNVLYGISYDNTNEIKFSNSSIFEIVPVTFKNVVFVNNVMSHNERYEELRHILNLSQNPRYEKGNANYSWRDNEQIKQGMLSYLHEKDVEIIINNTNNLINSIESFELDKSFKYPHIFEDEEKRIKELITIGVKERKINKLSRAEFKVYKDRINEELDVMREQGAIAYMLLEHHVKEEMRKRHIYPGDGRGSSSGSLIAYLLHITDVNPITEGLVFSRFMSKYRHSLADIDSDYATDERFEVQKYLLEHDVLRCASVITYGTLGLRGAIKDIGRALKYDFQILNNVTKSIKTVGGVDHIPHNIKTQYKELLQYVDDVVGTITHSSRHAAAILVSDRDIYAELGYTYVKGFDYPVTCWDMSGIEQNNYVKLDILGLDNVGWIHNTVKLANIDRLHSQSTHIDYNDKSLIDDLREFGTSTIFQLESQEEATKRMLSKETLEKVYKINPDITLVELISLITAVIRPGSQSILDDVLSGEYHDYGVPEINDILKDSFGHLIYQEQTISLIQYAGFDAGEADVIRRAISKKKANVINEWIPEFKLKLVNKIMDSYPEKNRDEIVDMVDKLAQVIIDSSAYSFNKAHAVAYSYISVKTAWLRKYYLLEWLTSGYIMWHNNLDKVNTLNRFAKLKGINIERARYGYSKGNHFMDKETQTIYGGTSQIKGMNAISGDELYNISQNYKFDGFLQFLIFTHDNFAVTIDNKMKPCYNVLTWSIDELKEIDKEIKLALKEEREPKYQIVKGEDFTMPNSSQMLSLIRLGYFSDFGNELYLEKVYNLFKQGYNKSNKTLSSKGAKYQKLIEQCSRLDKNKSLDIFKMAQYELEYLGNCTIKVEGISKAMGILTEIVVENKTYTGIMFHSLQDGITRFMKVESKAWMQLSPKVGSLIEIKEAIKKPKAVYTNGQWKTDNSQHEVWVSRMIVRRKGM